MATGGCLGIFFKFSCQSCNANIRLNGCRGRSASQKPPRVLDQTSKEAWMMLGVFPGMLLLTRLCFPCCSVGHVILKISIRERQAAVSPRPVAPLIKPAAGPISVTTWQARPNRLLHLPLLHLPLLKRVTSQAEAWYRMQQSADGDLLICGCIVTASDHAEPGPAAAGVRDGAGDGADGAGLRRAIPRPDRPLALAAARGGNSL